MSQHSARSVARTVPVFFLRVVKLMNEQQICSQNNSFPQKILLGPLCYKLITIVNCYLETGLTCFVYYPKALYLFIFIVWLLL